MAIGWFADVTAANAVVATMSGTTSWTSLTSTQQTAYLMDAYYRIKHGGGFTVPDALTADQLARLQRAQAETAWYMKLHKADEDRRMGLQAQGVTEADIVGETYQLSRDVPVPNIVRGLLYDMGKSRYGLGSATMIRNDEED